MCYNTQVTNQYRGVAQFGRAPRSGRGGRKFESCHLDQKVTTVKFYGSYFSFAVIYLKSLYLRTFWVF